MLKICVVISFEGGQGERVKYTRCSENHNRRRRKRKRRVGGKVRKRKQKIRHEEERRGGGERGVGVYIKWRKIIYKRR